jgi:hypothetical protein
MTVGKSGNGRLASPVMTVGRALGFIAFQLRRLDDVLCAGNRDVVS